MKLWIQDYFLIKAGYSKQDIENMDTEEYDFLITMLKEMKNTGKGGNSLFGDGI